MMSRLRLWGVGADSEFSTHTNSSPKQIILLYYPHKPLPQFTPNPLPPCPPPLPEIVEHIMLFIFLLMCIIVAPRLVWAFTTLLQWILQSVWCASLCGERDRSRRSSDGQQCHNERQHKRAGVQEQPKGTGTADEAVV